MQQDVTASFDRLVKIMLTFLDACEEEGDIACSKMAMIMVCTGYLYECTGTAGYHSFGRMAQCAVHALKGLACCASPSRAR